MNHIVYTLIQWTWGLVQNVVGAMFFLFNIHRPHAYFKGAVVTTWHKPYGLGCGMFIFLGDETLPGYSQALNNKLQYDILVHEYGHTIQSIILGPMFLIVIGLPSILWASLPYFQHLRKRKHISYYWLYCEKWANIIGDKLCRNQRVMH